MLMVATEPQGLLARTELMAPGRTPTAVRVGAVPAELGVPAALQSPEERTSGHLRQVALAQRAGSEERAGREREPALVASVATEVKAATPGRPRHLATKGQPLPLLMRMVEVVGEEETVAGTRPAGIRGAGASGI